MSSPKTLAERLDWMARNLPGFAQELEDVKAIERRATCDVAAILPVRKQDADAVARIAQYVSSDLVGRLDWWAHPDRQFMRIDPQWSLVYANLLKAARSA
ncbi:hypothetical protein [Janthinobacterium sp. ROICE36]|uniref:hypothetical protein n=1 Tax=Janthinobacterium sp. ROICE36 TaxID=2048670 RepID=UPI0011AEF4A0|nr:hypothetical protein [Janthinobacterium sp. ROICE36]